MPKLDLVECLSTIPFHELDLWPPDRLMFCLMTCKRTRLLTLKSLAIKNHWQIYLSFRDSCRKTVEELRTIWVPRISKSCHFSASLDSQSDIALDCLECVISNKEFAPGLTRLYCRHPVSFSKQTDTASFHLERLKSIHFTHTGRYKDSRQTELQILTCCRKSLEKLSITGRAPQITCTIWAQMIISMTEPFENLHTLKIFDANNTSFHEKVFMHFCKRMPRLKNIHVVITNRMYDERMCWRQVKMMLEYCPEITTVSFKTCIMKSIRILGFCKKITDLDLSITAFGRYCSNQTIKDCFRQLKAIQHLNCQSCDLTVDNMKHIVAALPKENLLNLDFSYNFMPPHTEQDQDTFADLIFKSATKFSTIQEIKLMCIISGLTEKRLQSTLRELNRFKKPLPARIVNLSENNIPREMLQQTLTVVPMPSFLTIQLNATFEELYGRTRARVGM